MTVQQFNFQQAVEDVREALQADFVGLALVDMRKYRHELKWRYVAGNISERYRKIVLSSGKGIAGLVFKTGKAVCAVDARSSMNGQDLFDYPIIVFEKLTGFGAVPLFKDDHVQGVLLLGCREPNQMTEQLFEKFKQTVGTRFGPFHHKERLKQDGID